MSIELPSSYEHTNISDGVRSACLKYPSKIAYKHGKKTRTYQELAVRIDSISSVISSFNIPKKSNVAIVASNSIEYMEIVLGASQLGHPIATINPKLSSKEIVSICEDAEANLIFVDPKVASILGDIKIKGVQRVLNIDKDIEDLTEEMGH